MRVLIFIALLVATPLAAQDRAQTLADIRQELTVLFVEIQKMKRELSTTGGVNVNIAGTNALERIDALEAEVARLTAASETVTNRVDQIVRDGTNRIGDLEFRLCELEAGCDIASLGDTPTLGGGAVPDVAAQPTAPVIGTDIAGGAELAVAEREDFERAKAAYEEGNFQLATERLKAFTDTYQGGPLSGLAHLMRGEALQNMGQNASAARAFLDSYSGTPDGPTAPTALLKLGISLDGLGQRSEACITLGEVTTRFPTTDASVEAQAARASLGCA